MAAEWARNVVSLGLLLILAAGVVWVMTLVLPGCTLNNYGTVTVESRTAYMGAVLEINDDSEIASSKESRASPQGELPAGDVLPE